MTDGIRDGKNISYQQFGQIIVPAIPLTEQTQIAAFLDRETAKIDELVAEQRLLMELLKEKRQAVISHAVTQGLNPDGPMKPSGIEWLGDVPEHWEICLLKRAFRSVDYGISDSLDSEGSVAILRMGNIANGKVVTDDLKYINSVAPYLLLQPGDLLYNRTNSLDLIGKVGMFIGNGNAPVSFASYLVRLRTVEKSLPDYFAYLLNTEGILGLARSNAFVAIGQCNLNPTRYGQITVAIPPRAEQAAIVEYLDTETAKLDTLTAEAQRAIDLLQERRSALISAAVTGQIDVRLLSQKVGAGGTAIRSGESSAA
jgi:type I restriction enzyme S subunit